jgi:molybdate/tungstate transport system permease protein
VQWRQGAALAFGLALLYPLAGLFAPVGAWQWDAWATTLPAVRTSLLLTAVAMLVIVAAGTPMAAFIARASARTRLAWQAVLLVSVLLPPLALGILLSLAFGPFALGAVLQHEGLRFANTPLAFVVTQVYVGVGYYVLGAAAAIERVPRALEAHAQLLGADAWTTFRRITLPLASAGMTAALSLAWVRALGEFGAVAITAYYPAGMPVALWTNLQAAGLPAVMPLLVVFLAAALPLPWLIHLLAERRTVRA